jgi:hypothetical protein
LELNDNSTEIQMEDEIKYSDLNEDERALIDAVRAHPRLVKVVDTLSSVNTRGVDKLDDVVELVRAAEAVATLSACDESFDEAVHQGAAAAVSELLKQALARAESE